MKRKFFWLLGALVSAFGLWLMFVYYYRTNTFQSFFLYLIVRDFEPMTIADHLPIIVISLGYIVLIINWWNAIKHVHSGLVKDPSYDRERLYLLLSLVGFAVAFIGHDKGNIYLISINRYYHQTKWIWLLAAVLILTAVRSFIFIRRSSK